jgi:hypothetical protein
MLAYVLWLIDAYAATSLEGIVTLPAVLDSIGVWGYRRPYPALLPLLLHLLVTVTLAGLSRNQQVERANAAAAAAATAAAAASEHAASGQHTAGPVTSSRDSAQTGGSGSTPVEIRQGVGTGHTLGGVASSGEVAGGLPISAAGRELRQLVSFGARMSYKEGGVSKSAHV